GILQVDEDVAWENEERGELRPIFRDGSPCNVQTLAEIRERIEAQL
ncbi:hypothetical protein LCGC14_2721600, partial [marine sediment metagenome]